MTDKKMYCDCGKSEYWCAKGCIEGDAEDTVQCVDDFGYILVPTLAVELFDVQSVRLANQDMALPIKRALIAAYRLGAERKAK